MERARALFAVTEKVFDAYQCGGGKGVHLPSLIIDRNGTALAVCQQRKGSARDWAHETDILLRRSTDGGVDWEPAEKIFSEPGVNAVNGPLVEDRTTGTLLLTLTRVPESVTTQAGWVAYHAETRGSLVLMKSVDGGRTWSEPVTITPEGPDNLVAWPNNSAHGIQLASGRLVIPGMIHEVTPRRVGIEELELKAGLLYSDDHGRSWRIGAVSPYFSDELSVAETPDRGIYANYRLNNRTPKDLVRVYGLSLDQGESFSETGLQDNMSVVNCHAGLCRHPERGVLLYSGPVGPEGHMLRTVLTVRVSYDGGRSWPLAKVLTEGSAEYSDLAVGPDGTILCLYGVDTFREGSRMDVARFNLEWIELRYRA